MGNLDKKYGCESVKNKDEIINSHMKPLQLGKVGKAIQGECKKEKGTSFLYRNSVRGNYGKSQKEWSKRNKNRYILIENNFI